MIVAGEMLTVTDRNRNNVHSGCVEQLILNAACQGRDYVDFPDLPQDKQVELLRAGYAIDFNTDKGKLISHISWANAH